LFFYFFNDTVLFVVLGDESSLLFIQKKNLTIYYFIFSIIYSLKERSYYKTDVDGDGVTYYLPVLEFEDQCGKKIVTVLIREGTKK
jgi:hypothetical protein